MKADAAGIPLIYFYNWFPRVIKSTVWFGLILLVVCLLGASWARSVDALIVLQGVGPGEHKSMEPFVRAHNDSLTKESWV
jgi:hypothetical protein